MDGAIRFTQRDAVASIIIVVVNIGAGFAIGVLQHGLSLQDAIKTYTILTVGDGVSAAVPSLFISVAAAIITTRSTGETSIGNEMSGQLLGNPRPLYIAAGSPRFPRNSAGNAAYRVPTARGRNRRSRLPRTSKKSANRRRNQTGGDPQIGRRKVAQPENIEKLLRVDALALEVGYGLVGLVSEDDSFLNRIREIRRQAAIEFGIIVPSVHVTDNLQLGPREYSILLKGEKIASDEVQPDAYLAIDPGAVREKINGVETLDPSFGMPAVWIRRSDDRDRAVAAGYTVVDPTTVICTHLSETIKKYAPELLGRQETRQTPRFACRNPSENRRRSHAKSTQSG